MAARRRGGRVAEWQIELGWWWQWSPLASSSYRFRRREGGERLHAGLAWHVGWLARYLGAWRCPCPVVSSGLGWMEPGFGCRQARGPAGPTINLVGPARAPPWMDGRMEGCVDAASPFFCPPTRRQPGTRPKTTSPYQQQTWQLLHSPLLPLTRSLARRRPFTRARISQTCFHARPRRRGSPSSSSPSIYPNSSHRHSLPRHHGRRHVSSAPPPLPPPARGRRKP